MTRTSSLKKGVYILNNGPKEARACFEDFGSQAALSAILVNIPGVKITTRPSEAEFVILPRGVHTPSHGLLTRNPKLNNPKRWIGIHQIKKAKHQEQYKLVIEDKNVGARKLIDIPAEITPSGQAQFLLGRSQLPYLSQFEMVEVVPMAGGDFSNNQQATVNAPGQQTYQTQAPVNASNQQPINPFGQQTYQPQALVNTSSQQPVNPFSQQTYKTQALVNTSSQQSSNQQPVIASIQHQPQAPVNASNQQNTPYQPQALVNTSSQQPFNAPGHQTYQPQTPVNTSSQQPVNTPGQQSSSQQPVNPFSQPPIKSTPLVSDTTRSLLSQGRDLTKLIPEQPTPDQLAWQFQHFEIPQEVTEGPAKELKPSTDHDFIRETFRLLCESSSHLMKSYTFSGQDRFKGISTLLMQKDLQAFVKLNDTPDLHAILWQYYTHVNYLADLTSKMIAVWQKESTLQAINTESLRNYIYDGQGFPYDMKWPQDNRPFRGEFVGLQPVLQDLISRRQSMNDILVNPLSSHAMAYSYFVVFQFFLTAYYLPVVYNIISTYVTKFKQALQISKGTSQCTTGNSVCRYVPTKATSILNQFHRMVSVIPVIGSNGGYTYEGESCYTLLESIFYLICELTGDTNRYENVNLLSDMDKQFIMNSLENETEEKATKRESLIDQTSSLMQTTFRILYSDKTLTGTQDAKNSLCFMMKQFVKYLRTELTNNNMKNWNLVHCMKLVEKQELKPSLERLLFSSDDKATAYDEFNQKTTNNSQLKIACCVVLLLIQFFKILVTFNWKVGRIWTKEFDVKKEIWDKNYTQMNVPPPI